VLTSGGHGVRGPGPLPLASLCLLLGCLLLALHSPSHADVAPETDSDGDIDRAEQLSSSDSAAALHLLDKIQSEASGAETEVQWLMVRGLAYADTHDEEHVKPIIQRLHQLGRAEPSAEAAGHIVQSWLFHQQDQIDRSDTELKLTGSQATLPAFERFRLGIMRGILAHSAGQYEAGLSSYEQALTLANEMHSVSRTIEAMLKLYALYIRSGNLDQAAAELKRARPLAEQSGDEQSLVEISSLDADLAEHRGDRSAQLSALLDAEARGEKVGSDKLMWEVTLDLSGRYLEDKNYAKALAYAKQSLIFARRTQRKGYEAVSLYNMGAAQIGLGQLAAGKQLAESAIQDVVASGNLMYAETMLRDYLESLETAGDLRGALDVFHRDDKLREQLMTTAREKALLELSAKFDDERRMRQIELLQRDNAIKSRDLQAQRLRQQMIVMAATLIALTCGALAWGISRIRKVNARLLHSRQHDPLTGLRNRAYFNEHILARRGDRPYVGCLLLLDLDRFKRINGTLGHAAGDAVLAAIGQRLSGALRDGDILMRWGGQQFLAMLGPMSQAELELAARRLLQAVRGEPVTHGGEAVSCTVSIGGGSFPLTGATINVSLDRAIALVAGALAQAKRRGYDRACLICVINADSEQELISINTGLEEAAVDHRVQIAESAA
jgi:diguanylate cyclase (GGDEF)-like protein